jgi:four helix bundle protein
LGDENELAPAYRYVKSEGFDELAVYRHAGALADEIRDHVRRWHSVDLWTCGVQMIRAADAIGADIAEAFGRGTRPDQARFLFMARGSAFELQHWLWRARNRSLTCPPNADERAAQIGRMLNGLIRSFRRSPRPGRD